MLAGHSVDHFTSSPAASLTMHVNTQTLPPSPIKQKICQRGFLLKSVHADVEYRIQTF